jgi:hypothetical protein
MQVDGYLFNQLVRKLACDRHEVGQAGQSLGDMEFAAQADRSHLRMDRHDSSGGGARLFGGRASPGYWSAAEHYAFSLADCIDPAIGV